MRLSTKKHEMEEKEGFRSGKVFAFMDLERGRLVKRAHQGTEKSNREVGEGI